ncbi:MAG: cobalamin-binding protein [Arenicella sp.]
MSHRFLSQISKLSLSGFLFAGLLTLTLSSNATDQSLIRVTDFLGNITELPKPAKRIIALAPHIVENVYSAGAGKQLVGVVNYSNFPEETSGLPIVGGYQSINLEAIISLQPDLILGWESGNKPQVFEKIRQLGIPLYIDQPHSLEDVARAIKDIGQLSGNKQYSIKAAKTYLQRLKQLRQRYQDQEILSVFYQVWNKPLYTLNDKHIISDIIRLCGGHNIYADEAILSPVISLESLLQRDPQVIIASGMGEQRPQWLEDWRQWPSLQAVKQDTLYFVPPDLIQRHTMRILQGTEMLCEHLATAREKYPLNTIDAKQQHR